MTTERIAVWDAFLHRWPIEDLAQMTLSEYSSAGNKDCFTQWLESNTDDLGSIWGGSSFKFGVYSRKDTSFKPDGKGRRFGDTYAWLAKYGETAEHAFSKVREIIVSIAQAARLGDMQSVEVADLGTVTKWKIAFLYQDRSNPIVLPIYRRESLVDAAGQDSKASCSALHTELMGRRGDADVLTYGDEVWEKVQAIESEKLTTEQAQEFFKGSDRYEAIKAPTDKMAGFRASDGLEIALALDNKTVTLYLSAGDWVNAVRDQVINVVPYEPGQTRSSNIAANAPTLAVGKAIVKVNVGSRAALLALCDAYENADPVEAPAQRPETPATRPADMNTPPLNQILYGPPGTGKTYATIDKALEILDPIFARDPSMGRRQRKARFDELLQQERIRFVTFHQSFSYEDFIEGIRAIPDEEGRLTYPIEPGVFKLICDEAQAATVTSASVVVRSHPRIWKISIDGAGVTPSKTYCLDHGEARIGWGETGDLRSDRTQSAFHESRGSTDQRTLRYFADEVAVGDIFLCIHSASEIGSVGVVTGDYRFDATPPAPVHDDYKHVRPVQWLYRDVKLPIQPLNDNKQFTLPTVYSMERLSWGDVLAYLQTSGRQPVQANVVTDDPKPYVLVIDEINRGNVSRIFGELITLIEPSKRQGAAEALTVTLPYSKKPFGVPKNLYVVGTMNTADKSLTTLDLALRRRFDFVEMLPKYDDLNKIEIGRVNVGQLLSAMNQRIEVLIDRDHCIGHAMFMHLATESSLLALQQVLQQKVLPLLQEYFFEDWQRIAWVLNDHRKANNAHRFLLQPGMNLSNLFGDEVEVSHRNVRWMVNAGAFKLEESYLGVIEAGLAYPGEPSTVSSAA